MPECGFKLADIKNDGRLGCPACYKAFGKALEPILQEVHQHLTHKGKSAHKVLSRNELRDRLKHLEKSLAQAIKEERFEDAAQFRDEIKELQVGVAE